MPSTNTQQLVRTGPARHLLALILVLAVAVLVPTPFVHAAEYKSAAEHPGFLSFEQFGLTGEDDNLKVEVNLQDAVLAFFTEALRPSEPELAEALSKILSIRFQLFELTEEQEARAGNQARTLANQLEARGWQRVVRIQENDTQSYLHLKMDGNSILGLAVVFLKQGDDPGSTNFGLINLAGEVDPAQLGRIGQRFNIDVLEQAEENLGGAKAQPSEAQPEN